MSTTRKPNGQIAPKATKALPPLKREADGTIILVPATKATKAATKAPAKKATAAKATAKKAPAKRTAAKATPAKKAAAKKATPAKATSTVDQTATIKRIAALRAEGQSWRVLSATLNAEGVTTVRGKTWAANGMAAFTLARKNGIS